MHDTDNLLNRIVGVYAPDTHSVRQAIASILEDAYLAGARQHVVDVATGPQGELGDSGAALRIARTILATDPTLASPQPASVPLETEDDVRELVYLVRDLHWCGSVYAAALRVCRYLRHVDQRTRSLVD